MNKAKEEPLAERLMKRIEDLIVVLEGLAKDLHELVTTLKAVGPPIAPAPPRMYGLEDVRMMFPEDLRLLLDFEEAKDHLLIRPRHYLGSENFAKIASIVRSAGGEYVSAGRESHFRVPRKP